MIASHNFKQLVKPDYTITFCDHIKNVKQILRKYDRVNRPLDVSVNKMIIEETLRFIENTKRL